MKKDLIVDVENLNLVFATRAFRTPTVRDLVIETVKNPLRLFESDAEQHHVLKDLNFKVYRGDRIGLIGVNGVGKTSLCHCLAKTYRPTRGSVQVNGRVRSVFNTSLGIFPELTGRENAELLIKFIYPELQSRHKELLQEVIDFSELKEFAETPFRHYSNGMQARLCLSIISCMPGDLLILDEVFDGADQFFRTKIAKRVRKMIEQSGAVVFVSHSPDQVVDVCNRVLVLSEGRILFDGNPKQGLKIYEENFRAQQSSSDLTSEYE